MKTKETVIFFCAHPDDEAIGPGGTIAAYAKEGKNVIVVLFTNGEASHPWLKEHVITKRRQMEVDASAYILGVTSVINLKLRDSKLKEDYKSGLAKKEVLKVLKKHKPQKVFAHARDDMLYPDHVAVHNSVVEAVDEYSHNLPESQKPHMYTFNIWSIPFRKRNTPQLYVDITETFDKKKRALKCFKSQRLALAQLWPTVYAKAYLSGKNAHCKYAEKFYKIR
ncbi:MAG: LmbE family N-acetylglucosaminyl deacetylase [Candidatus Woesearchaeota archaeon]|jgi:LmbE family N-acetylglucosaminyl deacetylase